MSAACVIFDLDGTLIDSRRDLTSSVNLMRADFGLPPLSLTTVSGFIGNGAVKLIQRSLQDTNVDVMVGLECYKKHYAEHMTDETQLYDGVANGLASLHSAQIPLAVITNKHQEACNDILTALNVRQFFSFVIGGGSHLPLKPEPDALVYILKEAGSDPSSSWMVGDHYTDMEAGRRAGMRRCLAAYGFGDPRDESWDLRVDCFQAFVDKCLD